MLHTLKLVFWSALVSAVGAGCNDWQTPPGTASAIDLTQGGSAGAAPVIIYPSEPNGLHVEQNKIKDSGGNVILLRGVNRSGPEYQCVNGSSVFDGPSDDASVQAMTTWNVNAVRVPLNESCWLGINGVASDRSGSRYKAAIAGYVNLLHKYRLTPILDLHWTAEGTKVAHGLQPMPDADHASAFWMDVASTFLDDTGVVFELFNEPYPDLNKDTTAAWECWRDGCEAKQYAAPNGTPGDVYQAVGMQTLVTAVRSTGATHLILVGGIQYSNNLSQWLVYKPTDQLSNLAPAWHVYNNNSCNNQACWASLLGTPGALGQAALGQLYPIVTTELGENDCSDTFVNPLMQTLESYGGGYLAWTWSANGRCTPDTRTAKNNPWPLITDYVSGTPNGVYAQAVKDHLTASIH